MSAYYARWGNADAKDDDELDRLEILTPFGPHQAVRTLFAATSISKGYGDSLEHSPSVRHQLSCSCGEIIAPHLRYEEERIAFLEHVVRSLASP